MRTAIANSCSAAIHLVALGGLAVWSLDPSALQYRVASGRPIVIEFAPAPSPEQSEPEAEPVTLEMAVVPAQEVTSQPTSQQHAIVEVDRQVPLVEIAEEVASAEAPIEVELPEMGSPASEPNPHPPESAGPQRMPQRKPTTKPPELQTAALPAPPMVEAGATVDSFPRKLPNNPAPPYPQDAWLARVQGRVVLKVRVDSSGLVGSVALHNSSGSASLDEAALSTVRTWRFEPARRRGTSVAHEVLVPVRFTIVPN